MGKKKREEKIYEAKYSWTFRESTLSLLGPQFKTSKKFAIALVAGSGSLGSQPEKLGRRDERLKSKAPGDEVASRGIPQISCGTQSDAFDFATGMFG